MKYPLYEIRNATVEDLDSIMKIEMESFVAPWDKSNFISEIEDNPFSNSLVIEITDVLTKAKVVAGFAIYWVTFDSATLCQIAVDKTYRSSGLGQLLLMEVLKECEAKKIEIMTLEVRIHNQIAIDFYKKNGFEIVLTKPKYYSNGDDAYYMTKKVN